MVHFLFLNSKQTAMKRLTTMKLILSMLLCIGSTFAFGQTKKTIQGTVTDSTGKGVPSVSVTLKGSKTSTITGPAGDFKIAASPADVILFTSIGYETREVVVDNQSSISVTLTAITFSLEGFVVTSLGLTKQQKSLGYAVSTIKAEDLTNTGTPNFATALYGKAPGVRIGSAPGGATSAVNITIRGINSITGKNQALLVLDGIPIRDGEVSNNNYWGDQRLRGNGLLDINPEDIDNVTILKGASAAALYGSEAVNGVVLITTKSGKGKKGFSVDVNTNYSMENVAFLPKSQKKKG